MKEISNLPEEVLDIIFDQVRIYLPEHLCCSKHSFVNVCLLQQSPSERRRSLRSLLRTNKFWREFAIPRFYRDLVIHSWDASGRLRGFHEDVQELRKGGLGEKYLTHARNVKIWDCSNVLFFGDGGDSKLDRQKAFRYRKEWAQEFQNHRMPRPGEMDHPSLVVWKTISAALQSFEELRNLILVCQNQVPLCLLEMIQEYHKNCQLHLRPFLPRSVSKDGMDNKSDIQLMKSPNLHSITFKNPRTNDRSSTEEAKRISDQLEIAALQLVATAPNIKHVNIVTGFGRHRGTLHPDYISNERRQRVELWRPSRGARKARLNSLVFNRWRLMHLDDIKEWSMCVELSRIRKLMLSHVSDPKILSYLTGEVGDYSLETFGISLAETSEAKTLTGNLTRLIEGMRYLKDIHLGGLYLSETLIENILSTHGPKLRRMILSPTKGFGFGFGSDEIQTIESHCQKLQFLKITIKLSDAYPRLCDVCPDLDTLQELVLQIDGTTDNEITQAIDATIRKSKRSRLPYLKVFDDVVSILFFSQLAFCSCTMRY